MLLLEGTELRFLLGKVLNREGVAKLCARDDDDTGDEKEYRNAGKAAFFGILCKEVFDDGIDDELDRPSELSVPIDEPGAEYE